MGSLGAVRTLNAQVVRSRRSTRTSSRSPEGSSGKRAGRQVPLFPILRFKASDLDAPPRSESGRRHDSNRGKETQVGSGPWARSRRPGSPFGLRRLVTAGLFEDPTRAREPSGKAEVCKFVSSVFLKQPQGF